MIQDTSFVIDVLDGDDDAEAMLELIERENRPEKIASITSLELYEGHRSPNPRNGTSCGCWIRNTSSRLTTAS